MKEICCIGHITLDRIVTTQFERYMPGGTAFYFAHGISKLNHPEIFGLVTAVAETEMQSVRDIQALGIDTQALPSEHTVFFENIYGENQNNRTQRVRAKAAPFTVEGLRDVQARTFHLGTLLADDFPIDVLRFLHEKGSVSVDAQGYLREVRGEDVFAIDWVNKNEMLPYIDILKVNEKEMEIVTGFADPLQAAQQLAAWGVGEVLVTLGSEGSLVYAQGKAFRIPAYPPKAVVDATGCGDTYMAGYLYRRAQGASLVDAACFAAAMSTIKLEASGPFSGTEAEIKQIIESSPLKPTCIC